MLPLAGDHGGVVEGELPGGEGEGLLPGEGLQVGGHAAALGVVGAEDHHGAAGLLAEGGGEVGPVGRGEPGQGRRAGAIVQGGQQGLKFGDPLQGGEEKFHSGLLEIEKNGSDRDGESPRF